MADPTPLPREELERRGSWRANIGAPEAPDVVRGIPPAPEWLEGRALECWDAITAQMSAMGILAESDSHVISLYCETWAQWHEQIEIMKARAFDLGGKKYRGNVQPVRDLVPMLDDEGEVMRTPGIKGALGAIRRKYAVVGFEASAHATLSLALHEKLIKLLREMGLTPAARRKVEKLPHARMKLVGGPRGNVGKPLPFVIPAKNPA